MSDIALNCNCSGSDLVLQNNDLLLEEGLETAIFISLFTDRLISTKELPSEESFRRGWWGDSISAIESDFIGSKLWLLRREKITSETLHRAKTYAAQALQWLIEDKIVQTMQVEVSRIKDDSLLIAVTLVRPTGDQQTFKYDCLWQAQSQKPAQKK